MVGVGVKKKKTKKKGGIYGNTSGDADKHWDEGGGGMKVQKYWKGGRQVWGGRRPGKSHRGHICRGGGEGGRGERHTGGVQTEQKKLNATQTMRPSQKKEKGGMQDQ